jgi:hypothetical protein
LRLVTRKHLAIQKLMEKQTVTRKHLAIEMPMETSKKTPRNWEILKRLAM